MKQATLLFVSAYAPYAGVPHAGGQMHYYYVRKFAESPDFQVSVVGFVSAEELPRIEASKEPFQRHVIVYPDGVWQRLMHKAWRVWLRVAPRARHGGVLPPIQERQVLGALHQLKIRGDDPDLIVLEWTQMALLAGKVRQLFPRSRIVVTEQDCLFQWAARAHEQARGIWRRRVLAQRAEYIRKVELAALRLADLVLVVCRKDAGLLIHAGLSAECLQIIVPYFQQRDWGRDLKPSPDILFFGAMDRVENYAACHWFLDEVMPLIEARRLKARFVILGSRPPESLRRRTAVNVEVTGFVGEVAPYFRRALCLVAPLKLGAGIKVKVLEGMAAGLPVLTNSVGMEGIPARAGEEYFHCETAEQYAATIEALVSGELDGTSLGVRGKNLIRREFDVEGSYRDLHERFLKLLSLAPR